MILLFYDFIFTDCFFNPIVKFWQARGVIFWVQFKNFVDELIMQMTFESEIFELNF